MKNGDRIYCSFCGKSSDEVAKLVAGPNVYICDECVDLCVHIIGEPPGALVEGPIDLTGHIDHMADALSGATRALEELKKKVIAGTPLPRDGKGEVVKLG